MVDDSGYKEVKMKEHEVVLGALDVIVDALQGIYGVGSDGKSYFYDEDPDYDVTLEDGVISVPTKFSNKNGERLFITLKVGFDYE